MAGLRHSPVRLLPAILVSVSLAACGGGPGGPGAPVAVGAAPASEDEWRALATPRPEPMPTAPRVAVAGFEVVGTAAWSPPGGMEASLAASELVVAGLLRRQDVRLVERRRFTAAVDAERKGEARPQGAPRAGTSPGPEYLASATWSNFGTGARIDVRLSRAGTSETVATWWGATPTDADPISLARLAVAGVVAALDSLGVRPAWEDPAGGAPPTYRASGIPTAAAASFFQGLAAEESWRWEAARAGYQNALAQGGASFVEAAAALARTARLRNGGTLGEG